MHMLKRDALSSSAVIFFSNERRLRLYGPTLIELSNYALLSNFRIRGKKTHFFHVHGRRKKKRQDKNKRQWILPVDIVSVLVCALCALVIQ